MLMRSENAQQEMADVRKMMAQAAELDLDGPWQALAVAIGVLEPAQAEALISHLHDYLRSEGHDPDRSL